MRALIIVDVQNDFLPGGSLEIAEGDQVIPVINLLQPHYPLVVATRDWHPAHHGSFAKIAGCRVGDVFQLDGLEQIAWPAHCVQGTPGAELAAALDQQHLSRVVTKGEDPQVDSYSAFFDNAQRRETGLAEYLRGQGVTDVDVVGLATDYCVKFTAIDAQQLGFGTRVILDACRGVNSLPGDVDRTVGHLRDIGVGIVDSQQVLAELDDGRPQLLGAGRFLRLLSRGGWEFAQRVNATGVVVVVPLLHQQVLLVEQYRPPVQAPVIEFPAGLAGDLDDDGESLQAAAQRELIEETGYRGQLTMLSTLAASAGLSDELLTFFAASGLEKVSDGGGVGAESIQCHWVPLDEVGTWLGGQQRSGKLVSAFVHCGLQLVAGQRRQVPLATLRRRE